MRFWEDKSVHLEHAACFSVVSAIDSLVILLIQAGPGAVDGIKFGMIAAAAAWDIEMLR